MTQGRARRGPRLRWADGRMRVDGWQERALHGRVEARRRQEIERTCFDGQCWHMANIAILVD